MTRDCGARRGSQLRGMSSWSFTAALFFGAMTFSMSATAAPDSVDDNNLRPDVIACEEAAARLIECYRF
jgi:hypothetical protein